jgi:tRNA-dihydrouridine synthase B
MGAIDEIKGKVLLAPMAGVTDKAFRTICKNMGAYLTYTEMVSAKALQFKNAKTKNLLKMSDAEKPAAVQIFGREPDIMADMAKQICDEYGDDIYLIDINMGCPAPKITSNGEGCTLMKTPKLASKIISAVKKNIDKPLTVKFRKGFDDNNINAVAFAKMCQESGADAICVHARTRQQFYSGKADIDIIKNVKKSVDIPVIGNGDIYSAPDAKRMFDYTAVDAIMVARGSMGNPFLFKQIDEYLKTGEQTYFPSVSEKMDTLLLQAKMMVEQKGEHLAIIQLRKHASWYIKGMKHAAKMREMLVRVNHLDELVKIVQNIKDMAEVLPQEDL